MQLLSSLMGSLPQLLELRGHLYAMLQHDLHTTISTRLTGRQAVLATFGILRAHEARYAN